MYGPIDNSLFLIIIFLLVFGIMAVFSAGAPEGLALYNNPGYYALKHLMFICFGLFLMFVAIKTDYRKLKRLCLPFAFLIIALIGATYIPGLGKTSYGASRWLAFMPLQPSELAKLACIMLASSAMVDAKSIFSEKMLLYFGLIGTMIVLVLFQPNLSIALLLSFTVASIMLAGGISYLLMGSVAVCMMPVVYAKIQNTQYQLNRITGWLNPWADPQGTGYNLIQSWYAIASGGFFGVGFGNSKQKLFWLPFRHTDFIFSVIAEELGFIGCMLLLGLFIAFIHKGFQIARRCPDQFGKLLAYGITFSIGIQAFINIGVAIGVLPVTGVTLPLISYGGSSLVTTLLMLGILLNISRKRIKKIQPREIENVL